MCLDAKDCGPKRANLAWRFLHSSYLEKQRPLSLLDGYEGVQDGNRRTSNMYNCLFAKKVEAGERFRQILAVLFFDWRGSCNFEILGFNFTMPKLRYIN